jgi:hypothetical protein
MGLQLEGVSLKISVRSTNKRAGGLMKKLRMVLFVFMISFALSGMAGASVLDFDDLSDTLKPIPNGYGGYHWSNFNYLDATDVKFTHSGYHAALLSPRTVAYNSLAKDASIVSDTPFNFSGTYFTGAWNNGLHIAVTGYLSGEVVGTDDFVASAYASTWYAPSWSGAVDKLTFHSYGGIDVPGYNGSGNHFAMDNFTVSVVHPVPLLPSVFLLAPGLFGIAVIRRRRMTN